jgi:DNA-binding Xre family transcriptional regulator
MIFKEVKKSMIDKGLSLTKLSDVTGYSRCHLSNVINGKVESVKAQKVISLALNKEYNEIFKNIE